MKKYILAVVGIYAVICPMYAFGQSNTPDEFVTIVKAKVLQIESSGTKTLASLDIISKTQTIKVEILKGNEKGKVITFGNDYILLKKGDIFYLRSGISPDSPTIYSVYEPYRLPTLLVFLGIFLLSVTFFGGKQGVRGLATLAGSFILIFLVLMPGILKGFSPILMSLVVASLIIVIGSYITHGFNKTTTSAVCGMILTLLFTGVLAFISVHTARLSGFASEEAMYLNTATYGTINFVELLLGGMLIGLLGVLYDAAIGQAVSVEELHRIGPHVPRKIIFLRAIRIGREHIGALVNTLAIAYVGISLPLLLLVYVSSDVSGQILVNREFFSTEIIRMLVGSIGLVLAVPLTTFLAIMILIPKSRKRADDATIEKEIHNLEHVHHAH